PEQVLLDPDSLVLPERGDRAHAALSGVVAAVLSDPTPVRWTAGWRAVARATERHADLAVVAVRQLARHRPVGAAPPLDTLAVMTPVLQMAGLLDGLTDG
ncbi:MAG: AAA family ATPase, partial [Acidimicrobiales bacterium]